MKVHLLYRPDDEPIRKKAFNEDILIQDLNLHFLFSEMAQDNSILYEIVKSVILNNLTDSKIILYRQEIVEDSIQNPEAIHGLFTIASKAMREAANYKEYTQPNYARVVPVSVRVLKAVGLLELLVDKLKEVKVLIENFGKSFNSVGLISFCSRINDYLTEDFMQNVKRHIHDLKYLCEGGKLILGARLGKGLKGTTFVLRKVSRDMKNRPPTRKNQKGSQWNEILLDNISIAKSAREMEDAGLIQILRIVNNFNSLTQRFFESLRFEAGFYSASVHLYSMLSSVHAPLCFPELPETETKNFNFKGLYDICLALQEKKIPVQNDMDANGKTLFVITGANQGGKSTFLRSIALAHLLMQCGLFVPAHNFCSAACCQMFTHFTREEDVSMNSGKLDEELLRMNEIITNIAPGSILLMNESFSTTTERDGSKIASDIIAALIGSGIRVFFVTHLFEFAITLYNQNLVNVLFLRAGREDDGNRSYIVSPGAPLKTSFGVDLFNRMLIGSEGV